MQAIEKKLETVFSAIEKERMQDMPICNPALSVKAIGFHEWDDFYLGIMLTPWFMNLMLIPRVTPQNGSAVPGRKQLHVFPSGKYEFVHAEEDTLGQYQVCSLFSPVFEFTEQQTAEETATRVLAEIMDEQNHYVLSTQTQPFSESTPVSEELQDKNHSKKHLLDGKPGLEEKIQTPLNRRQFLRSILPRSEERTNGD